MHAAVPAREALRFTASGWNHEHVLERKAVAAGETSSVQGGARNRAEGTMSSVSGGHGRVVLGLHDWAAGSLFEED